MDAFATPAAPILRSRYCYRRFVSPPWYDDDAFLPVVPSVVEAERYDSSSSVVKRCYRSSRAPWTIRRSIAVARYAGVDLFGPYRRLAAGLPVTPNLDYRAGVMFHRLSGEVQLIRRRPWRLFGFVRDCLDPRVFSDFDWRDVGPHASELFPAGHSLDPIGASAADVPSTRASLAA